MGEGPAHDVRWRQMEAEVKAIRRAYSVGLSVVRLARAYRVSGTVMREFLVEVAGVRIRTDREGYEAEKR